MNPRMRLFGLPLNLMWATPSSATDGGGEQDNTPNDAGVTDATDDKADEPPTKPGDGDEDLRPEGKRALEAERKARKQLETRLKELEANAAASFDERVAELEAKFAEAELKAQRADIARQHNLTDEHAALLTGDEEHMLALAKALAATAPKDSTPGDRKPDPAQGQGGGKTTNSGEDAFAARYGHRINTQNN